MSDAEHVQDPQVLAWQRKLLPYMMVAIAAMAVFFFVTSLVVLYSLYREVRVAPQDLSPLLASSERSISDGRATEDHLRWKTLVLLEQDVIRHRYQQVNSTLLLRAWTRYLGFLTGIILALVGAIFILGKLQEGTTTLTAQGQGIQGSLATNSPGIVLATLGTVLMGITLVVPFQFDTRDVAVYLRESSAAQTKLPAPAPLSENPKDLAREECELFPGPDCGQHEKGGVQPQASPATAPKGNGHANE